MPAIPRATDVPQTAMKVGDLAKQTGVSVRTLHYYDEIGLLHPQKHTDSQHRLYGPAELERLQQIKSLRELGFSLDDIRELLAQRHAQPCCANVKAIAARHLETVRRKLHDLAEMEASLAALVAGCTGEPTGDCAALDVLDAGAVQAEAPA